MKIIRLCTIILFLFVLFVGCGRKSQEPPDPWQYPLRFGAPREKVHLILGHANRTTKELEEYPMSGVTVWFDSMDMLTKITFEGDAEAVYPVKDTIIDWIPSDNPIYLGLTAHSSGDDFNRVLGAPIREYTELALKGSYGYQANVPTSELFERKDAGDVRRVWRKGGYLIEASFLGLDISKGEKLFRKGSLMWCEVSRGL